jgi:hypothetical protein
MYYVAVIYTRLYLQVFTFIKSQQKLQLLIKWLGPSLATCLAVISCFLYPKSFSLYYGFYKQRWNGVSPSPLRTDDPVGWLGFLFKKPSRETVSSSWNRRELCVCVYPRQKDLITSQSEGSCFSWLYYVSFYSNWNEDVGRKAAEYFRLYEGSKYFMKSGMFVWEGIRRMFSLIHVLSCTLAFLICYRNVYVVVVSSLYWYIYVV